VLGKLRHPEIASFLALSVQLTQPTTAVTTFLRASVSRILLLSPALVLSGSTYMADVSDPTINEGT